jgi:hypothetical protein
LLIGFIPSNTAVNRRSVSATAASRADVEGSTELALHARSLTTGFDDLRFRGGPLETVCLDDGCMDNILVERDGVPLGAGVQDMEIASSDHAS